MKRLAILTLLVAALAGGCGSDDDPAPPAPPAPPGSTANPVPADPEPGGAAPGEPGYADILEQQEEEGEGEGASPPRARFSPCNLVTRDQANAIVGEAVGPPVEAPQGPTCVYRAERGGDMVTLAIQPLTFERAAGRVRDGDAVEIGGRAAVCGTDGRSLLYVDLPRDRVLSVSASCDVATRFAEAALRRLG